MPALAGVTVLALAVLLAGCGLAARQVVQTARGGVSELLVIQEIRTLDGYETVRFTPIANDAGPNVSQPLLDQFNARVERELVARGVSPPRGKVLGFSGRVIHVEIATLHKEIIVRVALTDDGTGEVLGIANVTGQAGGYSDLDDLANGLADGVVRLLREGRFPQL